METNPTDNAAVIDLEGNVGQTETTPAAETPAETKPVAEVVEKPVEAVATPTVEELAAAAVTAEPAAAEAPAPEPVPEPQAETVQKEPDPPAPVEKEPEQPVTQDPPEPKQTSTPGPVATDQAMDDLKALKEKAVEINEEDPSSPDLVFNQVLLGSRENLIEDVAKLYPDGTVTEAVTKDPTSLFNRIVGASLKGWNTGDANTMATALAENNKVGDRLVEQKTCGIPRIPDGRPFGGHHSSKKVAGKEAQLLLMSRLGNLYRVNLLNSGFWVALKKPKIKQLNELFTMLDLEGREIGRTIGAHYALVSDMYLKRRFMELLISERIIVESNLTNIYANGAFIRNVSYHDYDTLLHAVVTLMTGNKGIKSRLVCPKCGQVSEEFTLDASACKFLNMDLFHRPATEPGVPSIAEWWQNSGRNAKGEQILRTEKDLQFYREKVLGFERVVSQTIKTDFGDTKIDLVFKNPTFSTYFTVGQSLIDQLNETIASISRGEQDKDELVRSALTIQGFQLVAPWISKLIVYGENGKDVDFETEDSKAILDYLDTSIQDGQSKNLFEELNKFTVDSRFNYIGSFLIQCPKCGAKPETALDNFFPLDIETIFFGLLFRPSPTE